MYDTAYNYLEYGKESVGSISQYKTLILVIVCVLVVAVLLYRIFRKKAKDVLIMGPFEVGTEEQRNDVTNKWMSLMNTDELLRTTSNNITVGFFLYVSQFSAERIPLGKSMEDYQYQPLMILGNSIAVVIDPIHQKAKILVASLGSFQTIDIPTLYIAKWNQISITVEGRSIDIYVNGNLVTSSLLENVPWSQFSGLLLNKSPDFEGQVGLIQVWPERRTMKQLSENYQRNIDPRGKPLIPDKRLSLLDAWKQILKAICHKTGVCGFKAQVGPMQYIEYEFA